MLKTCAECGGEIPQTRGRKLCDACFTSRVKREIGDQAFQVEWCYDLPLEEDGSAIIDAAKYRRNYFKTFESAMNRATFVYKEDKFGAVMITPVIWVDQHPDTEHSELEFRWEACGESKEYSG